jgi:3-dehydroquinate dehydratase
LLFFCALATIPPGKVFAQQGNASGQQISITASATVVGAPIELVTIAEMSLIQASQLQEEDQVYINPVFDPEAGIMKALGQPNASIRVSYISEREVFRREGPGSLTFHYEVSGLGMDSQRESELLDGLERELRFNESGEFYFWIGGRVDLGNALSGSYEGEFTIEIEYI